jgi:SprT protein
MRRILRFDSGPAEQLTFSFVDLPDAPQQSSVPEEPPEPEEETFEEELPPQDEALEAEEPDELPEPAANLPTELELTSYCQALLKGLGLEDCADKVKVNWNPRMRSTAGYASFPSWRIDMNPRLVAFEGQIDRTVRHELAHLIAYHRAGRSRIEPHGPEWRQACADLGIPDESPTHQLPLPRRQQHRGIAYQCPVCRNVVTRVRPFKRATACLHCCRLYAGGQYDERFRLQRVVLMRS